MHAAVNPDLFKGVGQCQRIHDSGHHTHMVGTGTLHLRVVAAAPEVAAANHNADLAAKLLHPFDGFGNAKHHTVINAAVLVAGKKFAAHLQQHALILYHRKYPPFNSIYYRKQREKATENSKF